MNAIKEARKLIEFHPESDFAKVLRDLVIALESQEPFVLDRLYHLDLNAFELAVKIIEEWRLDRYYAKKGKLLDAAIAAREMDPGGVRVLNAPAGK